MTGLSRRQREVFEFIVATIHTRSYAPTLREIGQHMSIRSLNGVTEHLRALERKGYIAREFGRAGAIRVLVGDVSSAPTAIVLRRAIDVLVSEMSGEIGAEQFEALRAVAQESAERLLATHRLRPTRVA